jgi:Putative MetA-pathway of phenol degradation
MKRISLIQMSLAATCSIFPALGATPLRELSTDRPDTTESASTVDKGHFQFEMEMAAFTRDGGDWTESTLGELNAKFGLTECSDLQVVMPFYTHVRNGDEGYGDMEVRLKYNLWGNDSGETAMALMPFVKIPSANGDLGNDDLEGGLIVPFAFSAPGDWSCAVMGEVDLAADDDGSGYHLVGLASATASHAITENTAGFLEIVGIFSAETSEDIESYFNTGMTWGITETWQLDGGIRVGLTSASSDFTPFVGISTKF